MKRSVIIFLSFIPSITLAILQVDLNHIIIDFGQIINQILTNCVSYDATFLLIFTSSGFSNVIKETFKQQNSKSQTITINATNHFELLQLTDFISISGILSISCSSMNPKNDSFAIYSQDMYGADKNNIEQSITSTSSNEKWKLTAKLKRRCTDGYGFNCNETCLHQDNGQYCYTCGMYGQKVCCNIPDINSDCSLKNYVSTTTVSPHCEDNKENLYFWLMIAFVIFSAVLILLIIILLGCLIIQRKKSDEEISETTVEEDEWPSEHHAQTKASRQLYDADISRPYSSRSHRRDMPYTVSRRGLDNQLYDEGSDDFEEIQRPRRVARV